MTHAADATALELADSQLRLGRNVLDDQYAKVQWHPFLGSSLTSPPPSQGKDRRLPAGSCVGCYLHNTARPRPTVAVVCAASAYLTHRGRVLIRRVTEGRAGNISGLPRKRLSRDARRGSVLADVAEVHAQRTQLAVEVRALHSDAFRELADLAVAQKQLLLQIRAFEL